MKILLINPPQWAAYGSPMLPVYPPLGLLQLAACLEQTGHSVRLLDADAEGATLARMLRWIRTQRPGLVGFTATTPSFPDARRWAAGIKSASPCPVVLGGPHASALPQQVLESFCFDYVIQGEGERSFLRLVEALDSSKDPEGFPGLWSHGGVPPAPQALLTEEELNELPPPAWHLLKKPNNYRPPDATSIPVATISLTRGCPGACRFCQAPTLAGKRVRYLQPDKVLEQTWMLHREMGAREIHIVDDCFTAHKKKALSIVNLLAERGPPVTYAFGNGLRADMLDEALLHALKAMGVHTLGFGIETASEEIARAAGKPLDISLVRQIIHQARDVGFSIWSFFMLGLPGETQETLHDTIHLAQSLPLDVAKFEIFKPYPGTPLYDELLEQGRIVSKSWAQWGIHTPPVHRLPGLSSRDILRARREAMLRFYLRPRVLGTFIRKRRRGSNLWLNLQAARFLLKTLAAMS